MAASQFIQKIEARNVLIANNRGAAASLEMDTGINIVNMGYAANQQIVTLPNSLFNMDYGDDTDWDDETAGQDANTVLQGNLAKFYDML